MKQFNGTETKDLPFKIGDVLNYPKGKAKVISIDYNRRYFEILIIECMLGVYDGYRLDYSFDLIEYFTVEQKQKNGNCPFCSNGDYYFGLNGHNCNNKDCVHCF